MYGAGLMKKSSLTISTPNHGTYAAFLAWILGGSSVIISRVICRITMVIPILEDL